LFSRLAQAKNGLIPKIKDPVSKITKSKKG
jgi:hypothetical protein